MHEHRPNGQHVPAVPDATGAEPPAPDQPSDAEQAAIRQQVNDAADLAAFHTPHSRDSAWVRGLIISGGEVAGVPSAVLLSRSSIVRLTRIAALLERAEEDAHRSPVDRLARALTTVVVQEIVHHHAQGGR
jgi:hypothetical protein